MLAALRLRGRSLIFPVAVASLHLACYWIGTDLIENLHRSLNDPLGMEPSPAAYTAKLMLMATFALSPPVMLWLYYRSTMLDRYLLRNFLPPFALCLGSLEGKTLGAVVNGDLGDALNVASQDDCVELPWYWNVWTASTRLTNDSAAVFHFMGAPTPWHAAYAGGHADHFFRYAERTPFRVRKP